MKKTVEAYYFTPQGLEKLENKIQAIRDELYQVGQDMGEWARQTSETWHDNFGFEDGVRQQDRLFNQLEEMLLLKRKAVIVKKGSPEEKATAVGKRTVALDLDSDEILRLEVGSYLNLDTDDAAEYFLISYEAPLAKALIGKEAGQEVSFEMGVRRRNLKVLEIN